MKKTSTVRQNTTSEKRFFDQLAASDERPYDVFDTKTNNDIIRQFELATGAAPGSIVLDLGCGSGLFGHLLAQRGYRVVGVDLSFGMLALGARYYDDVDFVTGNVEQLPFPDGSVAGVLLSGLVHHLIDPTLCAAEVQRVLKRGGGFMAFDPNRFNPFFWLLRVKSSPFYYSEGVSENEEPIAGRKVARLFEATGLKVKVEYLRHVSYRTASSRATGIVRPFFNMIDKWVFGLPFLRPMRAFVLVQGRKE